MSEHISTFIKDTLKAFQKVHSKCHKQFTFQFYIGFRILWVIKHREGTLSKYYVAGRKTSHVDKINAFKDIGRSLVGSTSKLKLILL